MYGLLLAVLPIRSRCAVGGRLQRPPSESRAQTDVLTAAGANTGRPCADMLSRTSMHERSDLAASLDYARTGNISSGCA